ncbi:ATPase, T2SS/T4P/T4SS family [Citrobacter koseri]|uniref:ATPase, T2SS/T4P/T4SS family n=1 Tax=Citrobacter koseri TaxID=545 RepID=UPI000E192445|nr:ATPase, T2SS/T4P/T4SS family [Citrobacter koseri]SUX58749.1 type IV pilus biogenesis protein CfcH [Citrobacter koseri]
MSLAFLRISSDELLAGKWTYLEFEGIGFTAMTDDTEYLLITHLEINDLFTYQIQISRLISQHKRRVVGLALVHEEDYYRVIEFVSLKQINDANKDINITDTQKQLAAILQRAVSMGASDLHITRNDVLAQLEARVNGVLMPFVQIKSQLCDELVFVLYNVEATTRDTTWNRAIPQSANILYNLGGKPYRFRYAHFPIFGETPDCYHAVLRIIPSGLQKGNIGTLDKIGISTEEIDDLKKILSNPYGAYVIAGTTGSGKSTTLKNLMEWLQINRYEDRGCFLTVEDPVEYQIYGAKQSSVVSVEGGGFHAAIKSALRRDPDVLMVGEIRDNISANALAGAVESGHYCFTTVHAGNIVSLLQRMSALGIGSDKLSTPGFIAGLQCQKLVPLLCDNCKTVLEKRNIAGRQFTVYTTGEGGCPQCKHSGIKGRQLAMEYFLPTYEELAAIAKQEWLNTFTLWRNKRHIASGLTEGFEIREKVMAHVLNGRVDASWYAMEFGTMAQEELEIIVEKIR